MDKNLYNVKFTSPFAFIEVEAYNSIGAIKEFLEVDQNVLCDLINEKIYYNGFEIEDITFIEKNKKREEWKEIDVENFAKLILQNYRTDKNIVFDFCTYWEKPTDEEYSNQTDWYGIELSKFFDMETIHVGYYGGYNHETFVIGNFFECDKDIEQYFILFLKNFFAKNGIDNTVLYKIERKNEE